MRDEDQSKKVALLFEECIEISNPKERAAFLDTACASCPELRDKLETLLRAYEKSGHFLSGGAPREAATGGTEAGLQANTRIGPYRLLQLIGEGNASIVFAAEQEEPVRRWVALKIVRQGMNTQSVILRFELERQVLALLDHPGIAKLLDAGETPDGRPFFVMELVTGSSIKRYCDENGLTIPERLNLFIQVCDAISHAHQRGIIHRDLKPDNILVSNIEGRTSLKIIDFGIAKVLRSWDSGSATDASVAPFLGTPAYMSPEQVQPIGEDPDARADIYSLGALLYELLTSLPPFDHKLLAEAGIDEMRRIICSRVPAPPSIRVTQLPLEEQTEVAANRRLARAKLPRALAGDLDCITLKALEKNRERRYETAAALADDIARHLTHFPVRAATRSPRYRFAKLLRRRRKTMIVSSALGPLLAASAILTFSMADNAQTNARRAVDATAAAVQAETLSHNADVAMYASSGFSAAEDRQYDMAVLWFANAALIAGENDYQQEVNARRAMHWLSEVPMPIVAFRLPYALELLEFSGDSRYLLALGRNRDWRIWDTVTRERLPWTGEIKGVVAAAWSPDGARIALALEEGEARIYQVSTGSLLRSARMSPEPKSLAFTPDGRSLVIGNERLQILNLEDDSQREVDRQESRDLVGLSLPVGSNRVAGVTADGWVQVFEPAGDAGAYKSYTQQFPHKTALRTHPCARKSNYREDFLEDPIVSLPVWTADGTRLLTRTGPDRVTLWDASSGERLQTFGDACCSCRFITSPETGLTAIALEGGKIALWDMPTGTLHQSLPPQDDCVLDLAFGGAGTRIATASANGIVRIWSVEDGSELQSPLRHSTDVDKVAFAANGRIVATAQSDGLVRLWNVFAPEPNPTDLDATDIPMVVRMDAQGQNYLLSREPNWNRFPDDGSETYLRQLTVFSALSEGAEGKTLQFDARVEVAAFSPDSSMLAVGSALPGRDDAGRVEFRDLRDGRLLGDRIAVPSRPTSLAWNPRSDAVAVLCRSGELNLVQPGAAVAIRLGGPVASSRSRANPLTAFTHDGRSLVALGPDGHIQVRDTPGGNLRFSLLNSEPEGIWTFALCGDSRHLATATVEGEVAIWDLESGEMIRPALKHTDWVYRCRFGQDQDTLITASHDGVVRLWNWRDGIPRTPPLVHPSEVYDAVITPDNRWLLTACRDGYVRIWEPKSGQLVAPPVKVGPQAFNIEIADNGKSAVVGTMSRDASILSLDSLYRAIPYDLEQLHALGEVASGRVIEQGIIRDLTTSEWLDRFTALQPQLMKSEADQRQFGNTLSGPRRRVLER